MATKGAFPIRVDSSLHGFAYALRLAACEWLLLFLLLLDAAFSFLLTKFAQYCELQLPCILCSRLEHILGKEKPDFYKNLLCNDHKLEISTLVSCHNHGKLVDVHGMCEECLFSFAKNESSEETYKLLVGKLGSDCFQKPLLGLDIGSNSLKTKYCSCCSKPWRSRTRVQNLIQSKSSSPTSNHDILPPKQSTHRILNHQEGLKKKKNRHSLATTNRDLDSLSHVRYTEVKISSSSESDYSFSDDEETITFPQNHRRDGILSQQGSKLISRKQYDDISPAAQFQESTPATSKFMFPNLKSEEGGITTSKFVVSNGDIRPGLGELNWPQIIKKAGPVAPELGSLDDIPLSSNAPQGSLTTSAEEDARVSFSKKFGASGFSNIIPQKTALPSKSVQQPAKLTKQKHIETKDIGDLHHASAMNNWEPIDLNSTSTGHSRNDVPSVSNNSSAIGGRDLPPINIKDVKPSTLFREQLAKRACNGIGSVEEHTASNIQNLQTESSINISSTMSGPLDELQKTESPRSVESQMKTKSPSIERSQSLESLEESVTDIEGETLVDRLKRQVEYDKKRIRSLHRELEEERNAAAIAANQAMAMITKLQEEKSALNMEALQYLRMMEEQAEYDMDALEKANDMIAEKEKVIQDLEAELDYFRIKYPEDFPEMNEEIMFAEDGDPQASYVECLEVEKL